MSDYDISTFENPGIHPSELSLIVELFDSIDATGDYTCRDLYESFDASDLEAMLEIINKPELLETLLSSDAFRKSIESKINAYRSSLVATLRAIRERRRPKGEDWVEDEDGEEDENELGED